MKWLSLSVVFLGEYVMATHSDLIWPIYLAIIILIFGIVIKVWSRKKDKLIRETSWGMVYGGVISFLFLLLAGYVISLGFILPNK